jgi:SIR2-like domain
MPKTRAEEIAERLQSGENKQFEPRESMLQNISKGSVIPVISNSFRIEQIFRELSEGVDSNTGGPSIYEQLSQVWASEIGYPGEDRYNLARVAKYFIEQIDDSELSKAKYLMFLSNFLFAFSEADNPNYFDGANVPMEQIRSLRFSDLVRELGYPRFSQNLDDPLRLLARLPIPVYITTSYFNFLEQALEMEGKSPLTQVCFWSGQTSNVRAEHRNNLDLDPSSTNPLVYHLYGLEDYPQTLVLSEDDFINFLISIAEDNKTSSPRIPLYLRKAVGESQLLLLGYQISDWDFRILFRLLMNFRTERFSPRGLLVQSTRATAHINDNQLEYLSRYFGRKSFDVAWNDAELFIQELWNEWDAYRGE